MHNHLRKGRALQLEGIQNTPVKVTIGFKCEGQAKIALALEAQSFEMTLSEYVEYLVSLRHEARQIAAEATVVSDRKLSSAEADVLELTQKVALYEGNENLQKMFAMYKGQTTSYEDARGTKRSVTINHISDVFNIVISTFKTE